MFSEIVRGLPPAACDGAVGSAPHSTAPIPPEDLVLMVASPERIRAWLSMAATGDQFLYATWARAPGNHPGAVLMRTLAGKGIVHLKQKRVGTSLVHRYTAERSSKPIETPAPRAVLSARLALIAEGETDLVNTLMQQLMRAARFRLPCPTDAQMARRAGVVPEVVPVAMAAMVEAGMIRVHAAPAPTLRRVTIVDSGDVTGMAA